MKETRRMFSSKILSDDRFRKLSHSAQMLYIDLNMNTDDDGFVSNTNSIILAGKYSKKDFELLKKLKFVLQFKSGICVIKAFKINNRGLRKERLQPTTYEVEAKQLFIRSDGSYTLKKNEGFATFGGKNVVQKCGTKMWYKNVVQKCTTQDNLTKDNLTKDNLTKPNLKEKEKEEEKETDNNLPSFPQDKKPKTVEKHSKISADELRKKMEECVQENSSTKGERKW